MKSDIKDIQKQMRNNVLRIPTIQRINPVERDSSSKTSDNEASMSKKVIVLEPDNILFTIEDSEIPGLVPNLVFERAGENGQGINQFLYLNQSYKPFLLYICEKFEVVLYSRLKSGILNQLMGQIKTMVPEIKFSAVFGASSCLNTKLI